MDGNSLPERSGERDFARLVSLACHDLRTPLATVQGFAKTLLRREAADEQSSRWLGLIDQASDELVTLLDQLSLAARIESGRYEPVLQEVDSLELARRAAPEAAGSGAPVAVDADAVERALASLVRAVERHGGEEVTVTVEGDQVVLGPVGAEAARVALGEELKDLGAAVAVSLVRALGGSVAVEDERLLVTLPRPAPSP